MNTIELNFYSDEAKEDIKKYLQEFPDRLTINGIHFSVIESIINELGWRLDWDSMDTNGWQHDVSCYIEVPGQKFEYYLDTSWYYPTTRFIKEFTYND